MLEKNRLRKFLITAAGGSVLTSILPQIKEIGFETIVFIDMDENVAIRHLIDNKRTFFYKCPSGKDKLYFEFIAKIIKKHNISYVIPGADEELLKILNLKLSSCFSHLKICSCNDFDFTSLCLDKSKLMNELNMSGFRVPKTFKHFDLNMDGTRKIIAKPKFGHGSKGLYFLQEKEVFKYIYFGIIKPDNYIFQEEVIGDEYTISLLGNGLVIPKKIIRKKGITIAAVVENNEKIIGQCKDLLYVFRLNKTNNILNVQGIIDRYDNKFKIFEINPRVSTSTCLTYAAGINEIGICLGFEKFIFNQYKIKYGVEMYRFNEQLFNNKNSGRTFLKEGIF